MMPTRMQLIHQADSNSDLDERTIDYLFLELLPAGTPSLKSSCQLPVAALQRHAQHNNTQEVHHASCTRSGKRLIAVCIFVLFCTSTWLARLVGLATSSVCKCIVKSMVCFNVFLYCTFYLHLAVCWHMDGLAVSLCWLAYSIVYHLHCISCIVYLLYFIL